MAIIGITGIHGAGKGTVVEYLETKGFVHLSVRAVLIEEIERRGLLVVRDSMLEVANDFRRQSPSYIVDHLLHNADSNKNYVIESLRSVSEAKAIKNFNNAYLWGVDADPRIRYERILSRGNETDQVSFEKFIEDEEKETTSENESEANITECIKYADAVFHNNGSKEELFKQVDKALEKLTL